MITVESQKEFEKALADGEIEFVIDGFTAILNGNQFAVFHGSSSGVFYGSSSGEFYGSSRGVFHESSRGVFHKSSSGEFYGSSSGEFYESSRGVFYESSRGIMMDFSCAHILRDTATVKILSPMAKIINVVYPKSVKDWCALKGIKIKNGRIILWKVVDKNGMDFYSGTINYDQAGEIVDPKWDAEYTEECGRGLHLADSPSAARLFVISGKEFRLFSVSAAIKDCRCFPGHPNYPMKLRARACRRIKEYPCDHKEST